MSSGHSFVSSISWWSRRQNAPCKPAESSATIPKKTLTIPHLYAEGFSGKEVLDKLFDRHRHSPLAVYYEKAIPSQREVMKSYMRWSWDAVKEVAEEYNNVLFIGHGFLLPLTGLGFTVLEPQSSTALALIQTTFGECEGYRVRLSSHRGKEQAVVLDMIQG
jgi:hypothetical protein